MQLTDLDYAIEARRYTNMADAALRRREYTLVARYTTFTCSLQKAGPDPEIYEDDREQRAFDVQRYEMSKGLRPIIESLHQRHCYFANGDGFFTLELDGLPQGHDYRVFFAVRRKSSTEVELVVKSAHVGRSDQLPTGARKKKVGFRMIIGKCLAGESRPPRNTKPRTRRGLLARTSWLSHAWCGPLTRRANAVYWPSRYAANSKYQGMQCQSDQFPVPVIPLRHLAGSKMIQHESLNFQ